MASAIVMALVDGAKERMRDDDIIAACRTGLWRVPIGKYGTAGFAQKRTWRMIRDTFDG